MRKPLDGSSAHNWIQWNMSRGFNHLNSDFEDVTSSWNQHSILDLGCTSSTKLVSDRVHLQAASNDTIATFGDPKTNNKGNLDLLVLSNVDIRE